MSNKLDTVFGWGVAAVIIAAIIGGLLMVGGPMKARDHKIDAKRLNNMQMTARVISCYADENGLSAAIAPAKQALESNEIKPGKKQRCRNLKWETDPVTNAEFEYIRVKEKSFEICGVFLRASDTQAGLRRPVYNANNRNVLDTKVPREMSGRYCYAAMNWENK